MSKTQAEWRTWGGKFHLVEKGDIRSVCGLDVGEDSRTTPYSSNNCVRCEKKRPDLAHAAEEARAAFAREVGESHQRVLDANRRGEFAVYRCRKCGRQHVSAGGERGAPFCIEAGHLADLELVTAQGSAWKPE